MSGVSRREFIGGLTGMAGAAALRPRLGRAASAGPARHRPRALVLFHLPGGIDSILLTDPKVRNQVDPRVDLPYEEREIVTIGGTRIGPLFGGLAPYVPQMAILNGVDGSTVAHLTGTLQVPQMRRVYPPNGIGITGTVGAARMEDAPCSEIWLGTLPRDEPGGRSLVLCGRKTGLLSPLGVLAELAKADLHSSRIDEALVAQLGDPSLGAGRASVEVVRAVLARLASGPAPTQEKIPLLASPETALVQRLVGALSAQSNERAKKFLGGWELELRDALHILTHRLAPAVFIHAPGAWDTHVKNDLGQCQGMRHTAAALAYFFGELQQRRTDDGVRLSDEVAVVITSELGRYPFLNDYQGKDHFPEHPVLFMGPGIRPGQYGETDRQMVATPISARTGRASSSAKDFVPTLDDVGATILHWFGIEDTASLGYLGRRLDFLLA